MVSSRKDVVNALTTSPHLWSPLYGLSKTRPEKHPSMDWRSVHGVQPLAEELLEIDDNWGEIIIYLCYCDHWSLQWMAPHSYT